MVGSQVSEATSNWLEETAESRAHGWEVAVKGLQGATDWLGGAVSSTFSSVRRAASGAAPPSPTHNESVPTPAAAAPARAARQPVASWHDDEL